MNQGLRALPIWAGLLAAPPVALGQRNVRPAFSTIPVASGKALVGVDVCRASPAAAAAATAGFAVVAPAIRVFGGEAAGGGHKPDRAQPRGLGRRRKRHARVPFGGNRRGRDAKRLHAAPGDAVGLTAARLLGRGLARQR